MFGQRRVWLALGVSAVVLAVTAVLLPLDGPTTSALRLPSPRPTPADASEQEPRTRRPHSRQAGSERWRLRRPAVDREIEGYSTRVGAPPGTPIALRVSTSAPTYLVRAYRIGSYVGGTGRQVWESRVLTGERQPAPRLHPGGLRMVTAPWRDTVTVSTTGWREGFYLLKLVASTGWQSHVPYVVTSRSVRGRVVLVAPVTTWQAYNGWGGYSLYSAPPGQRPSWAVSFDRPYPPPGSGQAVYGALPVVVEAERLGLQVGYLTNIDLQVRNDPLRGAAAYVSMGHDEYWTLGMRSTVLGARSRGTNLVFLGANTMYWRIRTLPSQTGRARVVVGYRHDARSDPATVRGDADATARFRDPPRAAPENSVTGMRYECFPVDAAFRIVTPRWFGFDRTGVRRDDSFDHLVGVEADRVYPLRSTPRPLQIVASVNYQCGGVATSAQAIYYTTPSGAGVFNAGTLRWTCALSARCGPDFDVSAKTRRFVRRVTHNVLRTFAAGPAGRPFPARDNIAAHHLPGVNQVPAS